MVAEVKEPVTAASVAAPSSGITKGKHEIAVPVADLRWEEMKPGSGVSFSVLWGDHKEGPFGMLLKHPAGGPDEAMHTHATDYHAVLVQGTWIHTVEGATSTPKELTPGSYVFQPAWQYHNEKFLGDEDCIVYIHQLGKADFIKKENHDTQVP